ncbi:MAG: hypothetical protein SAJ12_09750 [Jaaginema sp. PMC 1079.18]|nr:hypothetical protein [Jaaginema sp. PMC 1080.18]MEC4851283.1 hypothetical protein [Jaaginema sp. PMC 1079.18]MEC4865499.1 hypothetical protein [Jaaginema sp. PMC 1078.18]
MPSINRRTSLACVFTRWGNSPTWLTQKAQKVILQAVKQPGKVFNNLWTTITSFVAIFGVFLADQVGTGYIIVSVILLCFLGIGVWQEASKIEFYTKCQISLPIVFKITNSADSKNALSLPFFWLNLLTAKVFSQELDKNGRACAILINRASQIKQGSLAQR